MLIDLITSTEELLRERQSNGALRELGRGDTQYDAAHWIDTVREYYAAIKSGIKHGLDEEGIRYGQGSTLKDLPSAAARTIKPFSAWPTQFDRPGATAPAARWRRSKSDRQKRC